MTFPIIAIDNASFDLEEAIVFYRIKNIIHKSKFERNAMPWTYCDSKGELFKIEGYTELDEASNLDCLTLFSAAKYCTVNLNLKKQNRIINESKLRTILINNVSKLHFCKKNQKQLNETIRELREAKSFRELIECVFTAELTDEEQQQHDNRVQHQ